MVDMREPSHDQSASPRAMNARHRKSYLIWGQSNRVDLDVGESTGSFERFRVPVEFLRHRSPTFRKLLKVQAEGALSLPETPVSTFGDFFIWTFSPQPKIDPGADFIEVVQLGIFAWRYQISSLSNQVTDVIRSNIASREWPLQATIVDEIYDAVPSGSKMREVVRAALGQLPRPNAEGEVLKDEWKATFLKHAELGWDYIQAGATEWTVKDYLSDVCRFHDHQGVSPQGSVASCDGCPYAQEDCYPDTEDEADKVNGLLTGDQTDHEAVEQVVPEEPTLTNGVAAHEIEEPLAAEPEQTDEVQELESKLNGVSLEETQEEAAAAPEEVADDEINGAKESDSLADVDRATVASDEADGAKEDEIPVTEDPIEISGDHELAAEEPNGTVEPNDTALEEVDETPAEKPADALMERNPSSETKGTGRKSKKKRKSTGKA